MLIIVGVILFLGLILSYVMKKHIVVSNYQSNLL
jgi:hypothetical protein